MLQSVRSCVPLDNWLGPRNTQECFVRLLADKKREYRIVLLREKKLHFLHIISRQEIDIVAGDHREIKRSFLSFSVNFTGPALYFVQIFKLYKCIIFKFIAK